MLSSLFNVLSGDYYSYYYYYNFNFNYYKKILQFVPQDTKTINDSLYNKESDLVKAIAHFCTNNSNNNNKFIISLSGGIDSMVLISIIHYLGYEVIGLHINYNNRLETKQEQEFLTQWCNYNKIKLYTKVIEDIKRNNSKRSQYEFITKKIRFDFYKEIMEKENAELILLGHHKDDIVENIFANVCRGRYILDLAVIKETSIIENVNIARPMIDFYKKTIYDFADKYQVPYFKDTTPSWSVRGKYRNEIYPKIEDAFTPNVKENLIGLSKQSFEWNNLIQDKVIEPMLSEVNYFDSTITFNIEKYKEYPLCFWNVVFMKLFNKYSFGCPSRKGIQTFMNAIMKESNHLVNISLSNNCTTSLKKNNIIIIFQ